MDVREKLVEILKQAPFEGKVLDEWWWEEKIARIADHLIAHGITVQEWIPVKDRLPGNDTYVNAVTDGVVAQAYWHNDRFYAFTAIGVATVVGVTHWTPLPQPPKGE